eukprot:627988-Pyramimonas_sp.AAC.1
MHNVDPTSALSASSCASPGSPQGYSAVRRARRRAREKVAHGGAMCIHHHHHRQRRRRKSRSRFATRSKSNSLPFITPQASPKERDIARTAC